MIWFDGLDAPFRRHLDSATFEPGPVHDLPETISDAAFGAIGLVPDGNAKPKDYSPVFRYPWSSARPALANVPAVDDGLRSLRYVNPVTGASAMSVIDCFLYGLPTAPIRPRRSTANAVCVVAEGSGRSTVGDRTFDWDKHDVFTVPHGMWASHHATSKDATLFVMTDRDLMARLGLLQDDLQ